MAKVPSASSTAETEQMGGIYHATDDDTIGTASADGRPDDINDDNAYGFTGLRSLRSVTHDRVGNTGQLDESDSEALVAGYSGRVILDVEDDAFGCYGGDEDNEGDDESGT